MLQIHLPERTPKHSTLHVSISPSSQAGETELEILLSQARFTFQDLVPAWWSQDSLIYATLKLPHQTNAKEAEIEAVFPGHVSRQVCRYVGFSQVKR